MTTVVTDLPVSDSGGQPKSSESLKLENINFLLQHAYESSTKWYAC